MELQQLRFFVEIVKAGSLNKAAQRLNITQPALSRRIRALESEIGSELFVRHRTGMTPNTEGHRLLSYAEHILQEADAVRDRISNATHPVSGSVTVAAAPSAGQHYFAAIAEKMADTYPTIKVSFVEGQVYELLAGLEKGEVDIAFMIDPEPDADLVLTPLFSEPFYLIGARDTPHFPKRPVRTSDLGAYPLVTYPKLTGLRKIIDKAALKTRTTLDVRFSTTSHSTIKDFVRRGLGFALMSRSAIGHDVDDFCAARLSDLRLSRALVTLRRQVQSPAILTVIHVIKSHAKTLISRETFAGSKSLMS